MLFTKLEVTLAGYWLYSYLRFYEPRRSTWRSIKSIYFFHSPLFSTRPSRFSSICYGQPSCFRRSPLRFFRLRNSAWDFLGVNFILVKEFCVGFVESPRDFFRVLIFSAIRSSLSLEIRSIPAGQKLFPLGRHIPIWLIYRSKPHPPPGGKTPYTYQVFTRNALTYINRKRFSILQ